MFLYLTFCNLQSAICNSLFFVLLSLLKLKVYFFSSFSQGSGGMVSSATEYMILGETIIKSSVSDLVVSFLEKKKLSKGICPNIGTLFMVLISSVESKPPKTTDCSEFNSTTASALRERMAGIVYPPNVTALAQSKLETSGEIFKLIRLVSTMLGTKFNLTPYSFH